MDCHESVSGDFVFKEAMNYEREKSFLVNSWLRLTIISLPSLVI